MGIKSKTNEELFNGFKVAYNEWATSSGDFPEQEEIELLKRLQDGENLRCCANCGCKKVKRND